MKFNFGRFIPAVALLCVVFASCKKNDLDPVPSSQQQSTTQSLLLTANNTITNAGNQQSEEVSDILGSNVMQSDDSTSCRIVTLDPSRTIYPHLKTIDFGNGCTGPDGLTRSGKKLITVYANWKTASAGTLLSEITFSNFYVDSINVSGNVKIYIDSTAMPGPFALKIMANKTYTDAKGNTSTFTATSYWMQTAGSATTTKEDNVYQITTNASGSEVLDGATALTWTLQTDPSNPIIKMGDCSYRSKGGLQIQLMLAEGNVFNEYLDFGNGSCDDEATVTINDGTPQNITLPMRFWPLNL